MYVCSACAAIVTAGLHHLSGDARVWNAAAGVDVVTIIVAVPLMLPLVIVAVYACWVVEMRRRPAPTPTLTHPKLYLAPRH